MNHLKFYYDLSDLEIQILHLLKKNEEMKLKEILHSLQNHQSLKEVRNKLNVLRITLHNLMRQDFIARDSSSSSNPDSKFFIVDWIISSFLEQAL
jgi:predicted transcriptional regulator